MALRLFNTLTRSIEAFVPLDPRGLEVGMYCCGPTVHDVAHIGNFRTFVFADLLRRHLEFKGHRVRHVMNITDVEDKIIARVREAGIPLRDYTSRHERAFLEDLDTLRCLKPRDLPRATENIPDIIALIERLVARGMAYQAPDASVYFSIGKYQAAGHRYGQLVNLNPDELRTGERVRNDDYTKESAADFALWKARVPDDGEVFWPSPWGQGRPGWHIECSAMSMKTLGPAFDLHLGGEDLIFPHHEDEIAQSEGAGLQPSGCRFVKHWMHGAHLLVEGRKMSKSLGNYFTLRDLTDKGFSGREIRCQLLAAHYREPFNFTLEGLHGARTALGRIDECLSRLREHAGSQSAPPDSRLVESFTTALDEDLNVSAMWAAVFEWIRETNRRLAANDLPPHSAAAALAAWQAIDPVLAIEDTTRTEAPPEVLALLEQRQQAREARDFKQADVLRDALKSKGWVVEDTPQGPRLKPA
jgi:cysteinyl-tRNA synthetase